MKFRRILLCVGLTLLGVALAITWWLGSFFVDFALKRGNAQDPHALPKASTAIIAAKLPPHPKPNFRAATWTLNMHKEKRVATAFFAAQPTQKWIVLVHGYCRDQRYTWYYADAYLQRGYNVLTPDLNASGASEGQYLTMGVKESEDIVSWCTKLVQTYPQAKIALHGVSMGAATVLLAAQKQLPQQVYAVIEDCGYTSAYAMFGAKLEEIFGLPSFPLLDIINYVGRVKTGVYLVDAAPLKQMDKATLPILFIHGAQDRLISVKMADELYNACRSKLKEKYIVPAAGHARSMSTNQQLYYRKIMAFLQKAERTPK